MTAAEAVQTDPQTLPVPSEMPETTPVETAPMAEETAPAETASVAEEAAPEAAPGFDEAQFLAGRQTPMFFGSAINNFGVQEVLDALVALAPPLPPPPQVGLAPETVALAPCAATAGAANTRK